MKLLLVCFSLSIIASVTADNECGCNEAGMLNCTKKGDPPQWKCSCKEYVSGVKCSECRVGSFGLSANVSSGCRPCHCSWFGSVNGSCSDKGDCLCKAGITGSRCNESQAGFFLPKAYSVLEAEDQMKIQGCTKSGLEEKYTGSGVRESKYGKVGIYFLTKRMITGRPVVRLFVKKISGDLTVSFEYTCTEKPYSSSYPVGLGYQAIIFDHQLCIRHDTRMVVDGRSSHFYFDSVVMLPRNFADKVPQFRHLSHFNYKNWTKCLSIFNLNNSEEETGCEAFQAPLHIIASIGKTQACNCRETGPWNRTTCDPSGGGKCRCRRQFKGAKCGECIDGYYGRECLACGCQEPGTKSEKCNATTGQCPCKDGYAGRRCERCSPAYYRDGDACLQCDCNDTMARKVVCRNADGECACPRLTDGKACYTCGNSSFHANATNQCTACECDEMGSAWSNCTDDGQCECETGYAGKTCHDCASGFHRNETQHCVPDEGSKRGFTGEANLPFDLLMVLVVVVWVNVILR